MIGFGTMQPYDTDAWTFFASAGITDNFVQRPAVHKLVTGLKGYGLWPKLPAIYPVIGGTATSHAVNLKSPGTYNLVFHGTLVHSATGILPDGSTGYADTGIIPSTSSAWALNNAGMSYYSRTTSPAAASSDMGGIDSSSGVDVEMALNYLGGYYLGINKSTGGMNATAGSTLGLHHVSRTSSSLSTYYIRGASVNTQTLAPTGLMNRSIWVMGYNPSIYGYLQCAFSAVDTGMSSTDAANLYTLVQAYQTALSRNV